MKKILTVLLVIALAVSLSVSAFAADGVGLSASANEVKAGDTVTVSLTLAETLTEVASFEYNIYFDSAAFEFVSSEIGGSNAGFNCDNMGGYFMVSVLDMTGVGITLNAGTIYTLTFKAIADKENAEFKAEAVGVFKTDWADIADGNVAVAKVSVTHDHVWGEAVVVEPTCKNDGSETRTCTISGCDKVDVKVLPATGEHNFKEVDHKDATCKEDGYTKYECGCGETKTETIPATGEHVFKEVDHKDATCKEDGYTKYECGCGESKTETIPATGEHVYVETERVDATCEAEGYVIAKCGCGEEQKTTLDKVPHDYVEVDHKDATCTETGYINYECSMCKAPSTKVLQMVDHKWSDWKVTVEATKTEKGEKVRVCEVCQETETKEIPATGSVAPKTGDEANIALYAVMFVMAGAAVVALSTKKKEN